MSLPPLPKGVEAVVAAYPTRARSRFHDIRAIVLSAAADTPETGPLTETLKWGEPAYLTEATKSGATLRVAWSPHDPNRIGMSGASAGGVISLMMAAAPLEGDPKARDPIDRVSTRLQAVACFYPASDLINGATSRS